MSVADAFGDRSALSGSGMLQGCNNNLTKGQQAMALAVIYPEAEKGGRGKHSQISESFKARLVRQLGSRRPGNGGAVRLPLSVDDQAFLCLKAEQIHIEELLSKLHSHNFGSEISTVSERFPVL